VLLKPGKVAGHFPRRAGFGGAEGRSAIAELKSFAALTGRRVAVQTPDRVFFFFKPTGLSNGLRSFYGTLEPAIPDVVDLFCKNRLAQERGGPPKLVIRVRGERKTGVPITRGRASGFDARETAAARAAGATFEIFPVSWGKNGSASSGKSRLGRFGGTFLD